MAKTANEIFGMGEGCNIGAARFMLVGQGQVVSAIYSGRMSPDGSFDGRWTLLENNFSAGFDGVMQWIGEQDNLIMMDRMVRADDYCYICWMTYESYNALPRVVDEFGLPDRYGNPPKKRFDLSKTVMYIANEGRTVARVVPPIAQYLADAGKVITPELTAQQFNTPSTPISVLTVGMSIEFKNVEREIHWIKASSDVDIPAIEFNPPLRVSDGDFSTTCQVFGWQSDAPFHVPGKNSFMYTMNLYRGETAARGTISAETDIQIARRKREDFLESTKRMVSQEAESAQWDKYLPTNKTM